MCTKSSLELWWAGKSELKHVCLDCGCCCCVGHCGVALCRGTFCGLGTIVVCCFKGRAGRPSHPIARIQSMTHKWAPWDMGRSVCKANQRILFSLPRGGVGVGVRTWEPEGSLVKICSRIAGTLLALVIRRNFFPSSIKHLPIKVEGVLGWRGERQDYEEMLPFAF